MSTMPDKLFPPKHYSKANILMKEEVYLQNRLGSHDLNVEGFITRMHLLSVSWFRS